MAIDKLFQQFVKNPVGLEESESARAVDGEVLTSEASAGSNGARSNGAKAEPKKKLNPIERGMLEEEVIAALQTCYDPEIPINIYDLGLIYEINISDTGFCDINMTLTSPGCPVAGSLPGEVERKAAGVEGVAGAKVALVWEPPWTMEMLSEEARLELGLY